MQNECKIQSIVINQIFLCKMHAISLNELDYSSTKCMQNACILHPVGRFFFSG